MKFSSLQMIPWCFTIMGNHISCVQLKPEPSERTVKLIKSDGVVKIFNKPINASDLMLEFPKHLICHSDSFFIGQKVKALSEHDELKLGNKYFLLPKHFFQSVLSFITIASLASSPSSSSSSSSSSPTSPLSLSKNAFLKKVASCKPFDIHKTPSGVLQIRVSEEFISKLIEDGKIGGEEEEEEEESESKGKGKMCTTPELQKDYTQLVGCSKSKQWKPKLETIRESERRKLGAFGMRRRKKSQSKGTQKGQISEHLHLNQTPKIKAKKEL